MRQVGPVATCAFVTAVLAVGITVFALAKQGGTPSAAGVPFFVTSVIFALVGPADDAGGRGRPFVLLALCIDVLAGVLLTLDLLRSCRRDDLQ